jgi:drug/metabolite transporter (DMT)-like permease
VLAAFLTTIFFSLSIICATRSAKIIGGTEANFWRLALATLFLGIWAHSLGKGLGGDSLSIFVLSGVIGIGLGDVALFQALPRLGSRLTILMLNCLSTPFAVLIEWLWLGTKLTALQMACGLVILIGVGIALSPKEHLHIPRKIFWAGIVASIFAALGNAIGMVLSRKAYAVARTGELHIDGGTAAYQRLLGGLLVAGICLLIVKRREIAMQIGFDEPLTPSLSRSDGDRVSVGRERGSSREKWKRAWPWVVSNAIAGQTLGVSCLQWALEYNPTGIVLPITATTPLVSIPFAHWIEGEKPTLRSLIGGVIAVAGAVGLAIVR